MTERLPRLMSPKEAAAATTFSAVQLTLLSDVDQFPKPVKISARRIAFVRSEVEAWIDQRIAARKVH
ncbi:AlpA family phage regulatory protein [Agrobacterium tumefaciens]|nr:AlpA family phage regulatory protein [Agrobacterium tumefaciens]